MAITQTGITTSPDPDSLIQPDLLVPDLIERAPFENFINEAFRAEAQTNEKKKIQWQSDATRQLDSYLLDWDSASKGKNFELNYDPDPVRARKRGLVASYLTIQNGGKPVGGGELGPEIFRDRIANQRFGGRGVGSDEEFYAEIQKEAQTRKSTKELFDGLAQESTRSALVTAIESPDKAETFEQWREKAKASGVYEPGKEFSYREAWEATNEQMLENLDRYGDQLGEVWKAMKAGGAGTPSEVGKALLLDAFTRPMGSDLPSATGEEAQKKDAAAMASEVYRTLDPDDRAMFMDSLGQLADSLPKEERATFFGNLAKQAGRDVDSLIQNIGSIPGRGDDLRGLGDIIEGAGPTGAQLRVDLNNPEVLAARNFASDVRRIERGKYNPVKSAWGEGDPGWFEAGLYGAPGAVASTIIAGVPYIGQAAVFSSMQASAYDSVRDNLMRGGKSDAEASRIAYEWSPLIAAPQAALERLQAKALLGRFPLLEKTLNKLTDQVQNAAVRAGTRTATGAVAETSVEMLQDYMPSIVQEIGSAMGQEVPDVKWQGEGGILDGFWTQAATTMVSMLPLALATGAGGLTQEGRARAIAQATSTERLAFGFTSEADAAIEAAKAQGQSSLNTAIERALETRDPNSETAQTAAAALDAEIQSQAEAARLAADSGAFPVIIQSPDGWTVQDKTTGATYGPVASVPEAITLAQSNFAAAKRANEEQVAYLGSILDAVNVAKDDKTTTEIDLGTVMTPTMAAQLTSDSAQRVKEQLSLIEKSQALSEDFVGQVFGMSQTDFEQGQRQTINRLYSGANVATVFHEQWHGQYREALATNRISRDEALDFALSMDALFKQSKNKRGLFLDLFPAGVTRETVTDTMLDEAISSIAEAEVLRSRKGGRNRDGEGRANVQKIQSGFVTKNIRALAGRGMKAAKKFSALFEAVRQYFGIAMGRAIVLRQAQRNGKLDSKQYDQFVARITGLSEQDIVTNQTNKVGKQIVGDASFSIGSSLKEIENKWESEGIKLDMSEKGDLIKISRIVVPEAERGGGKGSAIVQEIINYADGTGKRIALSPSADFGGSVGRLREFYSRFGFKTNTGKGRDLSVSETMIRDPDVALSVGPEVINPLISNAVNRVQDPKQKARIMGGIVTRLQKLRQFVDQRGTAFNFDAFGKKFEGEFSEEKTDTLNALATLDAILAAMPPDLRGRVGGYTNLAKQDTSEKRLDYLKRRLNTVERVIDNYLKKEYGRIFDKLLDRAKPKKGGAGERPSGKAGADVHALFSTIEDAMTWSDQDLQKYLAGIDTELNDPNDPPTPEREAHLIMESAILPKVADWKNADAARRADALESATRIFEAGYAKFKLAKLLEKEERDIRKAKLAADTGKTGSREERDQKFLEDNKLKGGLKNFGLSLASFEQILEYTFGRNSADAIRIADLEREASNKKEDWNQREMDGLENLFTQLGGGSVFKGTQIRYDLSQKSMTVGGQSLSEMEAIAATMMWLQPDGKRHMEGRKDGDGNFIHQGVGNDGKNWHYDQGFIDEIESKLSDEAKAVRAYLMAQYATEYAVINPIFRELYGIDLPKNALYSPITVAQQLSKGQMADPVTGQAMTGISNTPGSLRTRGSSISEPKFKDALQTFIAHTKQMAHWGSYAPFMKEVSFLRERDLKNTIQAKAGEEGLSTLEGWINFFEMGGNRDASAHLALNQKMSRMASRAASAALVGRMSVIAIQSTQLAAAIAEMPTASFLKRLAQLLTGQLGWGKAIKSEYIQRRVQEMPVVVRHAMDGLAASKPNQIKHQVQKIGRWIGGADALFTAGTYAMVYDYQLSQFKKAGQSDADAERLATQAAVRVTERVAQPTRPGTRSLFENTAGGPAMRVIWSFASDARQKLALAVYRLADPNRPLGEKARAVALTWIVNGMIATLIRAALKDVRTDDDDETDDRIWNPRALSLAALTGPIQGIPFLGSEIESAAYSASGEYLPSGSLLGGIPNAFKAATRVDDWGEAKPDQIIRDIDQILNGLALFNDTISAASSISHLVRDAFGIAENATQD